MKTTPKKKVENSITRGVFSLVFIIMLLGLYAYAFYQVYKMDKPIERPTDFCVYSPLLRSDGFGKSSIDALKCGNEFFRVNKFFE